MKYIKTYEKLLDWRDTSCSNFYYSNNNDILKNCKFKIGDYVKIKKSPNKNIFEIFAIDPRDKFYRLVDIFDDSIGTWTSEKSIKIVPDHIVSSLKYNL